MAMGNSSAELSGGTACSCMGERGGIGAERACMSSSRDSGCKGTGRLGWVLSDETMSCRMGYMVRQKWTCFPN